MKRYLLGFATISLLITFSACDSTSPAEASLPANSDAIARTHQGKMITSANCETGESFKYQISANGCDTGDRIYFDRNDLCSGLQIDENNSDCPAADREDYFNQKCKGYTWNPDSDVNPMERDDKTSTPKKGLNLDCSFSRKIDPTDEDIASDPLLVKRQRTSAISLVIHQPGYYMNASQALNPNGTYSLVLVITDEAGAIIKNDSDSVDAGKDVDLKVESTEKDLQAICHGIDVKS